MDPRKLNYLSLALMAVLLAGSVWAFWPPATKIKQGLDIQGGLSVILTADAKNVDSTTMDRALLIMDKRVNGLGVSEATVQLEGANSILVQLPGVRDPAAALKAIGNTGQLEFVDWSTVPSATAAAWDAYLAKQRQGANVKPPASLVKGTYTTLLKGDVVTQATVGTSSDPTKVGQYEVDMTFNAAGTTQWAQITTRLVGKQVAIVLDGQVQSAPVIETPITGGQSQITGTFTADEAKSLATVLQTGALPVTLKFSDTQNVGPTLGQADLQKGLTATLVGLGLVALFLAVYYRGLGIVSWFSLSFFGALFLGVLGVMSAFGVFALSLPGIAGMVLSIGLAADTSILIFERFKEEVAMGKSPRSAAKSGTKHALLTSVDADVVTFVSAIVIYGVAVGPVKGFALTLMLGIVCDLTVGFLFTRPIVILLSETVVAKVPALFGVKGGAANA
jgi:preprotein translocase subunit SecD/SecD/SecF fusion protein